MRFGPGPEKEFRDMALNQIVWTFSGLNVGPVLGYKVFRKGLYSEENTLFFENYNHLEASSRVNRGELLHANLGKHAGHKIRVGFSANYDSGFHVFLRKEDAFARIGASNSAILSDVDLRVLPVLFSRPKVLGIQYLSPVIVSENLYVPTPDEVEAMEEGRVSDSVFRKVDDRARIYRPPIRTFDYRRFFSEEATSQIRWVNAETVTK
jgi:hypothetical protein